MSQANSTLPVQPITAEKAGSLRPALKRWQQNMHVSGSDGETDGQFVGLLAHRPELLEALGGVYAACFGEGAVSAHLKELLRITTADAVGCNRYCVNIRFETGRNAGISEADIAAARRFESSDLPESYKAAFRFARDFVAQAPTIDDRFKELKRYFSDAQIVEISVVCAICMGLGNMVAMYGLRAGQGFAVEKENEPKVAASQH